MQRQGLRIVDGKGLDVILASEIELGMAVEDKIGEVKSMTCIFKMMAEPTRSWWLAMRIFADLLEMKKTSV